MSGGELATSGGDDPHSRAAAAFERRVRSGVDGVETLVLFGSTARGDASGRSSDVDFLAVVSDDADGRSVADSLREIAYDVMLEFGPVVEVHVLSRAEFERRRDQPFVRHALDDGETHV